ncbi:major capsid protein [Paenibacillus sp. LX16]|uniref:major capsid protein n=1 Tax=Paenibacillus sp. LX16 TaxID=1740264 RepID=UPI002E299B24|nr:major capsid protein [Paenibacillus sp. LX16]
MSTVLELFAQKEILNYLKNRQYPALLGETLFPEIKRQSLEFDAIVGANRIPVIASIHGFDTESEIGSREAGKMMLELALIKRKLRMGEKEIIALESPRNEAERQYLMSQVFNDIDILVAGVRARAEAMRMEVLANGTVTLDENNLSATIDYGVPSAHKLVLSGTDLWSDPASDPIEILAEMSATLDEKPTRALTSTKVLSAMVKHPKVVDALYGVNGSSRMASRAELNSYLQQLELPQIAIYDGKYKKQGANGTYTTNRYFPENKISLFGPDKLGDTIYGPTAEEVRLTRDPSIQTQTIGNVLAMVYEEGKDPVSTWTKAVATALPSFPEADNVFQAQVL